MGQYNRRVIPCQIGLPILWFLIACLTIAGESVMESDTEWRRATFATNEQNNAGNDNPQSTYSPSIIFTTTSDATHPTLNNSSGSNEEYTTATASGRSDYHLQGDENKFTVTGHMNEEDAINTGVITEDTTPTANNSYHNGIAGTIHANETPQSKTNHTRDPIIAEVERNGVSVEDLDATTVRGLKGGFTDARGILGTTDAGSSTGEMIGSSEGYGLNRPYGTDGERHDGTGGTDGSNNGDGSDDAVGAAGARNLVGSTGIQETNSRNGATGATGELHGPDGRDGINGRDGRDGGAGATGELHGPDGRDGIDGRDGAVGATGVRGVAGESGVQGVRGVARDTERLGARGEVGATGAAGRDRDDHLLEELANRVNLDAPPSYVTMSRWGRNTCSFGHPVNYGLMYSSIHGKPICISDDCSTDNFPNVSLTEAPHIHRLTLPGSHVMPSRQMTSGHHYVKCATCIGEGHDTVMFVGIDSCPPNPSALQSFFRFAYRGYLMSTTSALGQKQGLEVCMDDNISTQLAPRRSPVELYMMRTGEGFCEQNKGIPCVICIVK